MQQFKWAFVYSKRKRKKWLGSHRVNSIRVHRDLRPAGGKKCTPRARVRGRKRNRALMRTRAQRLPRHLAGPPPRRGAITILQGVILGRGSRVISPSIYEPWASRVTRPQGLVVLPLPAHLGIPFERVSPPCNLCPRGRLRGRMDEALCEHSRGRNFVSSSWMPLRYDTFLFE